VLSDAGDTAAQEQEKRMIHKTAVIEPGAEIGDGVRAGPFAYVESGARVGDGCVLGPHVSILRYASIGPGCHVHAGAVLGDLPQDRDFKEADSWVRIGSGCLIREGVTVHRGTKPDTTTEVGDGCFLMAFSHLAHNVRLGRGVIVANGALLAGYVEVGDGAFISGNCVVHQFVRIGRLAMLGGGAAVSKDVPPFCMVHPLAVNRVIGLNVVGLRRAGMGPEVRKEIQQAFAMLYRSGLNVSQAVSGIRESFSGGPAGELADFAESSERGLCALRETG
jgi:UDP-N-acetylglucosamine acyltransferase